MKKITSVCLFLIICLSLGAQPTNFTWSNKSGFNYISPAKNQMAVGPCHVFASVAAVEAATQIYYNTEAWIDLAERHPYSSFCQPG